MSCSGAVEAIPAAECAGRSASSRVDRGEATTGGGRLAAPRRARRLQHANERQMGNGKLAARVSLNVTKTAAVVIDSGPQNTVRFGAGPLRFGSQVVARRIDVFGPFRAVMAGRIGTWVARDCHIRVSTTHKSLMKSERIRREH